MFWCFLTILAGVFVQGELECRNGATVEKTKATLTCDGNMTVYVDGKQVNNKISNYTIAQKTIIPPKSSILVIHCGKLLQNERTSAILGSIGNSVVTSSKNWMCTDESARNPAELTSWAHAFVHQNNSEVGIPFGVVSGISSEAEWIGTSKVVNGTGSLYCRLTLCPIKECVTMYTTRVENHKLEGFVFSQFHVKHVAQCGMKCFAEKDCRSFNFIPSSLSCQLNNSTERLGSKNLKPAPGVMYFYKND
ncbi:uncharacterized protein LOC114528471 [Dendronephthya gigantea]|uniref:uncharacterized protein LOC114528471 n=1 Tax=Dendronephthya gigantea TaxID=151771 RepID=UPI00106CBF8E|nr:uncharacterized protein LOC114528471 [Dendronephthya gigantea]